MPPDHGRTHFKDAAALHNLVLKNVDAHNFVLSRVESSFTVMKAGDAKMHLSFPTADIKDRWARLIQDGIDAAQRAPVAILLLNSFYLHPGLLQSFFLLRINFTSFEALDSYEPEPKAVLFFLPCPFSIP